MSQPNIDYMMNMTKEFLSGKIDVIAYSLDFPYELEQRYKKMLLIYNKNWFSLTFGD